MKLNLFIVFLVTILLFSCHNHLTQSRKATKTEIDLNNLFSDHMIIQRDQQIHIFGQGSPSTLVYVELAGNKTKGVVNENGKFDIILPKLLAGGPFELKLTTADTIIEIIDILIGDIWVCSGQSNMEFELNASKNGPRTISQAKPNQLRVINIPNRMGLHPLDEFRNTLRWYRADIDSINNFSAVATYFGLTLESKLDIPIGLINSDWGGTNIETWISNESFDSMVHYKDKIDFLASNKLSVEELKIERNKIFNGIKDNMFKKGVGIDEKWYATDHKTSDWGNIMVPGYWEDQIPELKNYDGVVWYKRTFDTSVDFDGSDLKIWLSQVNDYDMVWLNGVKIGEYYSPTAWRGYTADKSIVKRKNNVLVVRVYNRRNKGGFSGISAYFDYYPDGAKQFAKSLAGEWKYKALDHINDDQSIPLSSENLEPNNYPSLLFNAMIHPMILYPIKGVIWYQGEANVDDAYRYKTLFPNLINNWRAMWGIGKFPFYFAQLTSFGPEEDKLGDSKWAELREAQSKTLSIDNTGMATTIDVGNPDDIHPINKSAVGRRLAYNALHKTYDVNTIYSGPSYAAYRLEGEKVFLEFDHIESELITNNGEDPQEFLIAGADKIFYEATARIVDNEIILSCPKVPIPEAIRYAWKNSPDVNIFNKEGLPMIPFRTDNWEGITKNED